MPACELCATRSGVYEWSARDYRRPRKALGVADDWHKKPFDRMLQDNWRTPTRVADVCAVAEADKSAEEQFRELADKWERETRHVSSMTDIVMHSSYQAIIKMGPDVIPILLRDMEESGRLWFTALAQLAGENPVKPSDAGRVARMTASWLKWGKERGLL